MKKMLQHWHLPILAISGAFTAYYLGWYFVVGCAGTMLGLLIGAVCTCGGRCDLETERDFWRESYFNLKGEGWRQEP